MICFQLTAHRKAITGIPPPTSVLRALWEHTTKTNGWRVVARVGMGSPPTERAKRNSPTAYVCTLGITSQKRLLSFSGITYVTEIDIARSKYKLFLTCSTGEEPPQNSLPKGIYMLRVVALANIFYVSSKD